MSSDQHATAIEERLAIEQALAQVTELERRVALLKVAQFTSAEIAEQLGSTDRAIDQAYFRVRHKLKKLLGSQGEC
ncbi:MAG TPA: sigma factor-like helix-turn-helix DNA-binding protein [Candidatus Paceibacterota bacterium]|nr:sigma factor-like helix-turn-helix DNA-binding protein [Candidatus Paceibacterota bacterium]